jgi:hypothetical protein
MVLTASANRICNTHLARPFISVDHPAFSSVDHPAFFCHGLEQEFYLNVVKDT